MGIVHLATYEPTGQRVALKILSPNFSADQKLLKRFEREIEILKRLRHPNIVRYFGGGKHGSQRYYAMEYVDGGSLEYALKKRKKLTWEQTIEVGRQLCSALEHAHKAGIVHRDLKPGNLFVTKKGRLKLGDFGIARDTEATALTAAGKTVGTYAYMAPEQIVGNPPISGKTDLYALGCVLFQVLSGRTPFEADAAAQMMFAHVENVPPSVREFAPECPVWLDQLIGRLLAKDVAERPYDALAVATELENVKKRVAEGASVSQQTISGQTTEVSAADKRALKKALGKARKKKKKKQAYVPFYERLPVLLAALAAVIGTMVWLMWPLSEDELFKRAETLMATNDPDEWRNAREQYIEDYLDRFPDGQFAGKMSEYIDMIEVEKLERQIESRIKRGVEPESEVERRYMEAREYDKFGDKLTALESYRSIVELFQDRVDDRPYVNLARSQMRKIEESGADFGERVQVVNDALRVADAMLHRGNMLEARRKWQSIVTLYGNNQDYQQQVEYAQARLEEREVPPLNFDNPAEEPQDAASPGDSRQTASPPTIQGSLRPRNSQ